MANQNLPEHHANSQQVPTGLPNRFLNYLRIWDAAKGKFNKIPCDPTGNAIDSHNPRFHLTFEEASKHATFSDDQRKPWGVAFDVRAEDGLFFLDMDHCLDADGKWQADAQATFLSFAGALGEVSQSGTGLHVIGRCDPAQLKDRKNKWGNGTREFYTDGRIVAFGPHGWQPIGGTATDQDWTAQLLKLVPQREFLGELPDGVDPAYTGPADDAALIDLMLRATGGAGAAFGMKATVADLWRANVAVLRAVWPQGEGYDASSADAALMTHLAFWTGKDMPRMDRLFRMSGLMRDKYRDRPDYRAVTILGAARLCRKVYDHVKPNSAVGGMPVTGAGDVLPIEADWPEPDMSLLNPVRPPPPVLSDEQFNWVFGPWADWIRIASAAKGAPTDYVALGLLTTASALIGNALWPTPFADWEEPPILWGMLVGDPSSGKSPALDAVMAPLREIEHGLADAFRTARAEWDSRDEIAALVAADWKKAVKADVTAGKAMSPKPLNADAGAPPVQERLRVSDATTEKMAELLSQTSRGLLMYRDELSGWLGGMDRYSNGGDRPFWLEAYGGRSFTVDRKSMPDPIVVDRLSVAVIGGTQPDRLNSLLVKGDDDGLLARFLIVFPDPVPISRPTTAINTERLKVAFNRLRSLAPASDSTGKPSPVQVPFEEAALIPFQEFRKSCRDWEQSAQGCYKSHLGKLPGHVVRLSCVLMYLDCAASPFAPFPNRIDVGAIDRAIFLAGDYLRLHAFRAYGAMQDAPEIRSARKLARLIAGESLSSVTVREIQRRKLADLGTAREIETALGVLEQADWIRPKVQATKGRPSRCWIVNPHLYTALHRP